jgi:hypothetical protein
LWLEVQSGVGEEGADQPGSVLDPFEPVLHDGGELVDALHDQVSEVAFDVGPDVFGRVEVWG